MQKFLLTTAVVLLLSCFGFGQNQPDRKTLTDEATSLYLKKEFLQAGKKYSEIFAANGDKGSIIDRYNAACCWALANVPDSAFYQLYRAVNKGGYSNYEDITTDTDFANLYADKRWEEIKALVKANKDKAEANFDKPLMAILDSIYYEDQHYRKQIDSISQQHGWESEAMKAHWAIIGEKDSINLIKVKKILDERGWLGRDIVGLQGNSTLFLVIQHSDQATQEKYLPMMREAAQKGNASPSSLALLEDRVALGQGKRQIYGSQIGRDQTTNEHYVRPLDDPDHVDERRASVGLGPLKDYVSRWKIVWDVEAYKKLLPELEEKQKKK
ncbi:MAG: hypothetical protein IT258_17620 [Saprospiraceae bacterium]|nr:hypothetical protein [Saprospiraceae bacterium]